MNKRHGCDFELFVFVGEDVTIKKFPLGMDDLSTFCVYIKGGPRYEVFYLIVVKLKVLLLRTISGVFYISENLFVGH